MISFEHFRMNGDSPIYAQIILYLKRGIVAGVIRDGDELPSRRVLSALLGVNPNTVQKAYHLLEEEQLMQSRAGAKSCMCLREETVVRVRQELICADCRAVVHAMKQMRVTKEELLNQIDALWEAGEEDEEV